MGKYHLPDGETLVTDLQCLVVYTPDDPVYRQALWGAISQLTKFWMWEPDGQGGEHDAADSWDLAYAATLESFGMLEELLQSVDEVEPLLRQLLQQERCCDQLPGSGDIIAETEADGATSTTDVDGGVFPDGITTESEWDTYICAAATALIDRLIEAPGYITQFASFTISTITAIVLWYTAGAYIAIAGAIGGVLTLLDLFDLIDVFENLVAAISGGTEDEPGEVETKLQAIRDDLICDIVLANDAGAAATAVNNRIDGTTISTIWKNLFLLFFTNQYIMATVFNGEADQAPGATCDCNPIELGDFELVNTESATSWPGPADSVVSDYVVNIAFDRGASGCNSGSARGTWVFNTVDCVALGVERTVQVTFRINGFIERDPCVSEEYEFRSNWGQEANCPSTSPLLGSNSLVEYTSATGTQFENFDETFTRTFNVPSTAKKMTLEVNTRVDLAHAGDFDISIEAISVT